MNNLNAVSSRTIAMATLLLLLLLLLSTDCVWALGGQLSDTQVIPNHMHVHRAVASDGHAWDISQRDYERWIFYYAIVNLLIMLALI